MVKLQLKTTKNLKNLGLNWQDALDVGVKRGLKAIGMYLTNEIKKDVSSVSVGSVRKKRYNPVRHPMVSPAGKSPNSDRGDLRGSITWALLGRDSVIVGSTVQHGVYLENGTKKMKPRPFIEPNATKEAEKMSDIMMKIVQKRMDEVAKRA